MAELAAAESEDATDSALLCAPEGYVGAAELTAVLAAERRELAPAVMELSQESSVVVGREPGAEALGSSWGRAEAKAVTVVRRRSGVKRMMTDGRMIAW